MNPLIIAPDEVHIWHTDLNIPSATLQRFTHVLSADEHRRALAFRFEEHRIRWLTGRLFLRGLLSRYLSCPLDSLTFQYGEFGKPYLPYLTVPNEPVHFNTSHTGTHAVYAITRDHEIGVDIERIDPTMDFHGIVRDFFSPAEATQISDMAPAAQAAAFFRLWTRKEAYLKAVGRGIGDGLDTDIPMVGWRLETLMLPLLTLPPDHIISFAVAARDLRHTVRPLPPLETLLSAP